MSTGNLSLARKALAALHALRAHQDGTFLTNESRAALAAWPGWGPLAPAFDTSPAPAWAKVRTDLDTLFVGREKELAKAVENVDNAFFTPETLIRHMWTLLAKAGFTGGSVLEPGCGSGRFLTHAPADMSIDFTGVEIDRTSAAIAAAMHPEARIVGRNLAKVFFAENSFDVAIGNVPFSQSHIYDGEVSLPLHSYFLHRALDAVRPGGYVVVVTSRFQLDGGALDRIVAGRAELAAAVRLPSGYLEGTDVVADVLVLRKLARGQKGEPIPSETASLDASTGWKTLAVSRYWIDHPEMVAGRMVPSGHYRNPITVDSRDRGRDVCAAFAAAVPHLTPIPEPNDRALYADLALADRDGRPEGTFVIEGDIIRQVKAGTLEKVTSAGKELRALIILRDAADALVEADADSAVDDAAVAALREHTRTLYKQYLAAYGPLNRGQMICLGDDPETGEERLSWRQPRLGGFRTDPGFVTVMALENYDSDTGEATPADILHRRVNTRVEPVTRAANASDALAISMGEGRGVDLARIGGLVGMSEPAAADALGDLVFELPEQQGVFATARDYLSGNVRAKLHTARAAAARDPRWNRNVAALSKALPPQLDETDVEVRLGAPWVQSSDIEGFAHEVLGAQGSVTHVPEIAAWEVQLWGVSAEARLKFGTAEMAPDMLLSAALNGRSATVYDTTADGKRVKNSAATLAAEEKLTAMQQRFAVWIWEDTERTRRVLAEYNARYRSHVPRCPDGSYLTFPNLAGGRELWPWQKNMVDQILSSPRSLCGHAVGAGKTLTMAATVMTLRRLGLARKPLVTVPNHLLVQISREFRQAFPTGRFLIAEKADLHASRRRLFAARCATGDWDAVVMTHEAFTSIPVGADVEMEFIDEEKARLRTAMAAQGRGSKDLARALRTLEARLDKLRGGVADPAQVLFSHLGVDFIAVDEAHKFKRLPIATRSEGFSLGASKRATDLSMKIECLARRTPNRPVVALFTGTPWTNSLAETYVWQRYCQPQRLRETGVDHFDAWAAAFVEFATRVEVAPDGSGFRMHRRPHGFHNVTEMHRMLSEVSDLLPSHELPQNRPTPARKTVVSAPGPKTAAYVAALAERAEKIRSRSVRPEEDNMLAVCGDGRKAALDPMLAGLNEPSPKLAAVAVEAGRIYFANRDRTYGTQSPGALQLMLCDLGTPGHSGASTYGRLRQLLVEQGIPARQIRFVHEARSDADRAALFAACRDGSVAVLIGSTSKVGIGTNIQTRLVAVHHVDAPWMPSDIEQREGRALRPGNRNSEVEILTYVTENTFDAYTWQTLARKAAFIVQLFRSGDSVARRMEDISTTSMSYGEVLALATGNPHLLQRAELSAAIRRLQVERAAHIRNVRAAEDRVSAMLGQAQGLEDWASDVARLLAEPDRDLPLPGDVVAAAASAMAYGSGVVRFGRCRLRLISERGGPVVVRLMHRYAELAEYAAARKGGAQKVAGSICGWLARWHEAAPEEIESARARCAALRAEAVRDRAVAATAVFGKQVELDRLMVERHRLDEEIEAMAEGTRNAA